MVPVIALVGRPNVGKSTMFNRLTRLATPLSAICPVLPVIANTERRSGKGALYSDRHRRYLR